MDIERISMNMAKAETIRGFTIGMMRESINQVEQMGQQLAQMMDSIPTPAPVVAPDVGSINILA